MQANWITNGTARPFYARKKIELQEGIRKAAAKVCGLGQFQFSINGNKVGDHELDPAWTDYDKYVQYVVFDVTDLLSKGVNVIGAEVGNGWYNKTDEGYTFAFPAFMPPNPNPYHPYGEHLVLAIELTVEYENGEVEQILTDDSFQVKEHPVTMSNVYGSETYDGRLNIENWCTVDADEQGWCKAQIASEADIPKGKLKEQQLPPVRVLKRYEGKYLGEVNGRAVYDFSQNMSGILDFEIKGRPGDAIHIYPAEKLGADGDVDQVAKGWTTVDSVITAVVGKEGEWEHVRMKFCYFAGKNIAVAQDPDNSAAVEFRNIYADAISSAAKDDGTFVCDDRRYEQIHDMIKHTVEANMLGVHTDCPTIERFAWQEPNHLMAGAIFYMKDGKELWRKFLQDMRYSQHTKDDYFFDFGGNKVYPGDGLMPSQCPCYIPNVLPVPGMGSFYDIIPWGSTCILGTRWHYLFYGDKTIIEENYEAGKRYFAQQLTKVNEDGFINHGLGDWGNPENELARENIETAVLYADAVTLAWFAEILGRPEEQKKYQEHAERIRENYNRRLLVQREDGIWCYRCFDHPDELFMTQAAEAMPLFWGMVPEDRIDDVVKAFRETLECKGALIAGEVGLPYIIQTASRYGMNDLIAKYIMREQHPSYYAFIKDGMTTLGEYWETNPRSHCHDMMGHIVEWFYNGMAGIKPEAPGFSKVLIKPYLPDSVNHLDVTYRSAAGDIRVIMEREGEEVRLDVQAAEGIETTIDKAYLR
ncbi:MAG: family 78 glycoside hydrolase catalytic domain [Eubacteriales bacterium]|nr:family 78 glycoside hydrolase catalytic domain [Eubacteriales bacterium]